MATVDLIITREAGYPIVVTPKQYSIFVKYGDFFGYVRSSWLVPRREDNRDVVRLHCEGCPEETVQNFSQPVEFELDSSQVLEMR